MELLCHHHGHLAHTVLLCYHHFDTYGAFSAPKMVLSDAERQRLDEAPDAQFYATPRMMQHADEAFIAALGRE